LTNTIYIDLSADSKVRDSDWRLQECWIWHPIPGRSQSSSLWAGDTKCV